MIARITGALMRASLVALVVVTPALMLPSGAVHNPQLVVLLALLASLLTFIEYSAGSPSIVEFRDAAPFNRLRFLALFATVFLLTVICRATVEPTPLSGPVFSAGTIVGNTIDWPFSPVWMALAMLPQDAAPGLVATMRSAAGMGCFVSLGALASFLLVVRIFGWPGRKRDFNVWVNLPLFDPASGGDVLHQLKRDARINIALGLALPYLIPAVVKLASFLVDPITLENPQTLIWTMTAWAFLPASMIMRGLALGRVAEMIEAKRRRAHADQNKPHLQPV